MERASRRKCHYIYRTTCIITNRFYIGMHSTDNLEDGYIGSGKRLWHSINKHGKDNHVCEILEFLSDRSSLKAREKEIVNKELINEELCMNLQVGGEGGFISHEHMMKANKNSRISFAKKLKNEQYAKDFSKKCSNAAKKRHESGVYDNNTLSFSGLKHSEETKIKMSESRKGTGKGSKNSQFGTCWIFNDEIKQSIKIPKEYLQSYLNQGWCHGRKIKFN